MHPSEFGVNDAWVVFQVNKKPIHSDQGSVNCVVLVDAASCFMCGPMLVPADASGQDSLDAQQLLSIGEDKLSGLPERLFVLDEKYRAALADKAAELGLDLVRVDEAEVKSIIGEAQKAFPLELLERLSQ